MEADLARYVFWSDIAQAIWALFLLGACAGIWFGVFKLVQVLNKLEAKLDPLAGKGQEVLESVDHTLATLRDRAESMLQVSEDTVKSVATKVDTTTSLVEGAVARPAISVSSVMAGIHRGLETWRKFEPAAHRNGDHLSSPAIEEAGVAAAAES